METEGVVARTVDAEAVVNGERDSGDGADIEIGIEDQRKRDCGIVCQEEGVDERVGADSTPGDVGAEGVRPPVEWTASKRPRKEGANAAAVV